MLAKKRKLEKEEILRISKSNNTILQRKMPLKTKDLRSFTIPYTIGEIYFDRVLCDLGASINLMPYSIFKKSGLDELKPTGVTLQLVDRSIIQPMVVVEDVLVKVNKFIFPGRICRLDMEDDMEIPIIQGRPFLATRKAKISVHIGKLTLNINDEKVIVSTFGPEEFVCSMHTCFWVNHVHKPTDSDQLRIYEFGENIHDMHQLTFMNICWKIVMSICLMVLI